MGSSKATTYRLARPEDLPGVAAVRDRAVEDLRQRAGQPAPSLQGGYETWLAHLLETDPEGFWVAERGGEILGLGVVLVRLPLAFVSELWVLPDLQGQGAGGELLRRGLAYAEQRGTQIKAVYSSQDMRAVTLYLASGMHPRPPFFVLAAEASRLDRGRLDLASGYRWRELTGVDEVAIREMTRIDSTIFGGRRPDDHRFWQAQEGTTCLVGSEHGAPRGYLYFSADGHIGPLAVLDQEALEATLAAAIERAIAAGAQRISFRVPGANQRALALARAAGLTIKGVDLFLSSRPFGYFDRYVLGNPSAG